MDDLDALLSSAPGQVAATDSLEGLDAVEAELVGRRSLVTERRRGLGQLDPAERPAVGARLNEVAATLQELVDGRRLMLEREAEDRLLVEDRVDITVPRRLVATGTSHLITQTIDEISDIFTAIGYQIADGPEAETAWHNFDALNTPWWHPSRLESDTMYLDYGDPEDEILLRTHTSTVQARTMESQPPPVHVIAPGRCYRTDTFDATHSPVFHQFEGLAVAEGITFQDLKGTLLYFAREYFGPDRTIRLIPHFFPFTEPSAEMHVSCFACDGSGCRVCSHSGWIELLGCGMVDPNVFEAIGYDPSQVTGFAFGGGIERVAMVRHGIDDIRHLWDNDLRVNEQFV
ncbi:MAG: phenylalanine--tRNA ligase subunit alpha [Acidimicrobiia bacterium]|nr:phenylalanine--tRNA ligase subunit alpha [Acidimicrobiia bacterium]